MGFQGFANPVNEPQAGISLAFFHQGQVSAVDTNCLREFLLGDTLFFSQPLHFLSKLFQGVFIRLGYYLAFHASSVAK